MEIRQEREDFKLQLGFKDLPILLQLSSEGNLIKRKTLAAEFEVFVKNWVLKNTNNDISYRSTLQDGEKRCTVSVGLGRKQLNQATNTESC